jgi:hypothetical protein
MLGREGRAVRREDLKWSLSGRVLGTGAAMAVLAAVPPARLGVLFGGLVLAAVGLSASGLHPPTTPRTLLGAGLLSGFMGTTVSIGGPPIALLYQGESGPRVRATLSAFFLVGTVLSLAGLHVVGRFGPTELWLGLWLLPGIVLGFLCSRRLTAWVDRGPLRVIILGVSAAAGLAVVIRTLW